jgi:hypothetical protein
MAAIVRLIEPDTLISADTRILGVEIGTGRAPRERTATLPPAPTIVRLPPTRTQ